MPQLILEYSANIIEKDNLFDFLKKINFYLADILPADIQACKSRAIEHTIFCLADGDAQNAFVHVNLKVMAGRSVEKITETGNGMMNILNEYFHTSAQQLNLKISLEIDELQKTYFK